MNRDQVKGRVKKAAGRAKAVAGKVLHSPALTAKGRLQQAAGSVQAAYGDLKAVVSKEAAKTRRTAREENRGRGEEGQEAGDAEGQDRPEAGQEGRSQGNLACRHADEQGLHPRARPGRRRQMTTPASAQSALPPGTKNYITPAGLQRLKDELHHLLHKERPAVTAVVSWAAGNGDRSENADYQYGKRRLREIDRRIRFLTRRVDLAEVIDPALPRDERTAGQVFFGATVRYAAESGERTRGHYRRRGRERPSPHAHQLGLATRPHPVQSPRRRHRDPPGARRHGRA